MLVSPGFTFYSFIIRAVFNNRQKWRLLRATNVLNLINCNKMIHTTFIDFFFCHKLIFQLAIVNSKNINIFLKYMMKYIFNYHRN